MLLQYVLDFSWRKCLKGGYTKLDASYCRDIVEAMVHLLKCPSLRKFLTCLNCWKYCLFPDGPDRCQMTIWLLIPIILSSLLWQIRKLKGKSQVVLTDFNHCVELIMYVYILNVPILYSRGVICYLTLFCIWSPQQLVFGKTCRIRIYILHLYK